MEQLGLKLEKILGESKWEELVEENSNVPKDTGTKEEIRHQISELCGFKTIGSYVGGLDSTVSDFEKRYESTEKLKASIEKLNKDMEANRKKLDSMDEQMTAQLESGTNALTYDILSDGTKDTISLAFRLAMLEHLYPEGDGLAVFDDPFTDMDNKRVEQSCKLIEKFAKNNQVVFVTCDEKYKDYMSGNVINIAR